MTTEECKIILGTTLCGFVGRHGSRVVKQASVDVYHTFQSTISRAAFPVGPAGPHELTIARVLGSLVRGLTQWQKLSTIVELLGELVNDDLFWASCDDANKKSRVLSITELRKTFIETCGAL